MVTYLPSYLPSRYKREDIGLTGFNDSILLESCVYAILKKYFRYDKQGPVPVPTVLAFGTGMGSYKTADAEFPGQCRTQISTENVLGSTREKNSKMNGFLFWLKFNGKVGKS